MSYLFDTPLTLISEVVAARLQYLTEGPLHLPNDVGDRKIVFTQLVPVDVPDQHEYSYQFWTRCVDTGLPAELLVVLRHQVALEVDRSLLGVINVLSGFGVRSRDEYRQVAISALLLEVLESAGFCDSLNLTAVLRFWNVVAENDRVVVIRPTGSILEVLCARAKDDARASEASGLGSLQEED